MLVLPCNTNERSSTAQIPCLAQELVEVVIVSLRITRQYAADSDAEVLRAQLPRSVSGCMVGVRAGGGMMKR